MEKNNHAIAALLYEQAEKLRAYGDNPYRARAFSRAARVIENLDRNIYLLLEENFDLTTLPSIGKSIAAAIEEIVKTNKLPAWMQTPQRKINELANIQGLGTNKIKLLTEKYGIHTRKTLLEALKSHVITEFTPAFTEQIKEAILACKPKGKFIRLYHALPIVKELINKLQQADGIQRVECSGEFRRKRELIEHLIVLVQTENEALASTLCHELPMLNSVFSMDENHVRASLWNGVPVDIYFIHHSCFAASLLWHTGTEKHLKQLQKIACEKNEEIKEAGLYRNEEFIPLSSEHELYARLGLAFIEPELREDRGEIKAAQQNRLPELIELQDIKGDLHSHTTETDGRNTLETMVNAALAQGYEYLAITDHSKRLAITNGMDEKRLLEQIKQIDKLNAKLNGFLVLKSIEVDILEDGTLDLSNDILKELDIIVCSIHSKFRIDEKKQTERILRAMENPYFNILGHATGRLIRSRPPYAIDMDRILQAALDNHCFIELNAQPFRLDIHDEYCKKAKEKGVKLAISSDAHSTRELNFMQLGIDQARRGWLEKENVLNTRSWPELKKLLKQHR
ncbi:MULTISPECIES: DNA polymerase/3'-5' exonuclease PolX [Legionella]|uniref:DNA polymerase/3'-5' exonuclease PolX n=1 Tax=Legionella TaxID=445 RepID=UPI000F8E3221|nr:MULTISPECIES: DNA polymerase/3'-5' exonuclease PolX [Legionella]MCP0913526.1 DNA polymerase/3'-5' exonuclease PolX [Legionella sp. 27cVA30]RUQ99755.1 DNA polymerase/3'-5' exonuclease PolX [Legionella septentrionalis]RUR15213.1 DNA polymerase/3'-5' exonuclease PolX [Legionella septentrionalis]